MELRIAVVGALCMALVAGACGGTANKGPTTVRPQPVKAPGAHIRFIFPGPGAAVGPGRAVGSASFERLDAGGYTFTVRAPDDPEGLELAPAHATSLVWAD